MQATTHQLKSFIARASLACICLLLIQCEVKEAANGLELEPFFGTFKGTASSVSKEEGSARDLTVVIKPWEDKGFNVEWRTVKYRADGSEKESKLSINFLQSSRPGIFASAMRTDVFGHTVPYDPVGEDADPYVWAGLQDKTLTVTALYIMDGGGYEMQVYERTLEQSGMSLAFERVRNGEKVTQVAAQLDRMK